MKAIVGDSGRRHQINELLTKMKGEMEIMEEEKKDNTIELKPPPQTIKDYIKLWTEKITKKGLKAFWPSWAYGTYIKPDNIEAQQNVMRRANRKFPDIKEKVVLRHGKLVRILYNRKTGGRVPTKGMSASNKAKIEAQNKAAARQRNYFSESNALDAITKMIGMPRNLRRNLCRKLNMAWNNHKESYREAEATIREM